MARSSSQRASFARTAFHALAALPRGRPLLADQFTAAATAARNSATLDSLSVLLWKAHALGKIDDLDATAAAEAVQRRRAALATRMPTTARKPATRQRCNPTASLQRRRRQAMSGIVPAKLAADFTPGELAALSVIGWQIRRGGCCSLPIDAIAALGGVCRTVVKNALRRARAVGLVLVRERRIPRRKSLTNVVTAIGAWSAWLRLGGIGGRFMTARESDSRKGAFEGAAAGQGGWRTQWIPAVDESRQRGS
jgi:hypothetical protein